MKTVFLAALLAAAGLAGVTACQNTEHARTSERSPVLMSDRPADGPTVSPDMERYDAGIGDTATKTGGGHGD